MPEMMDMQKLAKQSYENLEKHAIKLGLSCTTEAGPSGGLRLVHLATNQRLIQILCSGELLDARSAAARGLETRSFAFDINLGLDAGVFFSPGFANVDHSFGATGAALVLSNAASESLLNREGAIASCLDVRDVLGIDGCTATDVANQTARYANSVNTYVKHVLPASQFQAHLWRYIDSIHQRDPELWLGFVFNAMQGRGFDSIGATVEEFFEQHSALPLLPEIIVPGPVQAPLDGECLVIYHAERQDKALERAAERKGITAIRHSPRGKRARFDDITDLAGVRDWSERTANSGIHFERERLFHRAARHFSLTQDGIHGLAHWLRVEAMGHWLAENTAANPQLITLFAFFHDLERQNENTDPGHGARGAAFARSVRGDWFECDDHSLRLLEDACSGHSGGRWHPDITVRTCWDADRLDLWRIGIEPRKERLLTDAGRTDKAIAEAKALHEENPVFVLS